MKFIQKSRYALSLNASFDMSVLSHTLDDYKILYPELTTTAPELIAHALWTTLPSYGLELFRTTGLPFTHHAVEETQWPCRHRASWL